MNASAANEDRTKVILLTKVGGVCGFCRDMMANLVESKPVTVIMC